MAYVDHCDTNPGHTDSGHIDSCYDFNNYADAWLDCAGHSDYAPELCPAAFQGDFHVDDTACHNDVPYDDWDNHSNVAFDDSAYSDWDNHSNVPFDDAYPHVDSHINTDIPFDDHYNTSHSHSCGGHANVAYYLDTYCAAGHSQSLWSNSPVDCDNGYYHCDNVIDRWSYYTTHSHSAAYNDFGNTAHSDYDDYSQWTDFGNTSHSDYPDYTDWYDFGNTTHSNWTDHDNVAFVDFCNHTNHNAG